MWEQWEGRTTHRKNELAWTEGPRIECQGERVEEGARRSSAWENGQVGAEHDELVGKQVEEMEAKGQRR